MSSVALNIRTTTTTTTASQRQRALATHTLRALLDAHTTGRYVDLDRLCETLGVHDASPERDGVRPRRLRREDVRDAVRQLDVEGFVDASRMRLTLSGFALASALTAPTPLHRVK